MGAGRGLYFASIVGNDGKPQGLEIVAVERKDVFDVALRGEDGRRMIDDRDLLIVVGGELLERVDEHRFAGVKNGERRRLPDACEGIDGRLEVRPPEDERPSSLRTYPLV